MKELTAESPLSIWFHRYENRLLGWGTLLVFLGLWELAPALGWVKPIFTSSPSRIFVAAQWLFANGFWADIRVSALEFGYGFALSLLVGIPLGVLMGWYRRFHAIFEPLITILYVTPRVALVPMLILWFGLGIESKVAIVFLGGVFAILFNVIAGMQTLDEGLVRCARSFGATDRQIFVTIALPSLLPFLIVGIKLAVGRALVGVLIGELVAANAGIGYMMLVAGATFQTDKVFVGVVLLAMVGWSLTAFFQWTEDHFSQWRAK